MSKSKPDDLLPLQTHASYTQPRQPWLRASTAVFALAAVGLAGGLFILNATLEGVAFGASGGRLQELEAFYSSVKTHDDLCVGGISHSGYIGLKGDTEDRPKRSFFWCEFFSTLHTRPNSHHVRAGTSKLRIIQRARR